MEDFKDLYFLLFNGITDIIEKYDNTGEYDSIINDLKELQIEAEERYISKEE